MNLIYILIIFLLGNILLVVVGCDDKLPMNDFFIWKYFIIMAITEPKVIATEVAVLNIKLHFITFIIKFKFNIYVYVIVKIY